jgi:Mrp family chromosome partitioning ATPase
MTMTIGKNKADRNDRRIEMEKQRAVIQEKLGHITNKILVMSGKGGVGKSSIAAYLSATLAKRHFRVGLIDIDLHGPSIPRIMGLSGEIESAESPHAVYPIKYQPNLEVFSIEIFMGDRDAATIWRGPLKGGVIRQFIADVEWGDLDYLIIDSPPGTGDEPLTVAQTIPDAKALIVTTPQEIALADVRKSINFCRQVKMEILGLVENMSGLQCPFCGKMIDVFKQNGGSITATKANLKLLATLPLDPEVVRMGDNGAMDLLDDPQRPVTQAFYQLVDKIVESSNKVKTAASETTAASAIVH